jgi:hypothetical protein
MSIGIPIKLLHEAEQHVITVELKSGELYRGYPVGLGVVFWCHQPHFLMSVAAQAYGKN